MSILTIKTRKRMGKVKNNQNNGKYKTNNQRSDDCLKKLLEKYKDNKELITEIESLYKTTKNDYYV